MKKEKSKKQKPISFTVQIIQDQHDPDLVLLDLGSELCERLGWQPGDSLEWIDNGNGTWTLTKPKQ